MGLSLVCIFDTCLLTQSGMSQDLYTCKIKTTCNLLSYTAKQYSITQTISGHDYIQTHSHRLTLWLLSLHLNKAFASDENPTVTVPPATLIPVIAILSTLQTVDKTI